MREPRRERHADQQPRRADEARRRQVEVVGDLAAARARQRSDPARQVAGGDRRQHGEQGHPHERQAPLRPPPEDPGEQRHHDRARHEDAERQVDADRKAVAPKRPGGRQQHEYHQVAGVHVEPERVRDEHQQRQSPGWQCRQRDEVGETPRNQAKRREQAEERGELRRVAVGVRILPVVEGPERESASRLQVDVPVEGPLMVDHDGGQPDEVGGDR